MVISVAAGDITCIGSTTLVTVDASGGTAPYTGTGTFSEFAGSHTYTVTDANSCSVNKTITITAGTGHAPVQPKQINGQYYNLCGGGVYNFSINPVAGATNYIWSVPEGFIVTSSGTTAAITVPATFASAAAISVAASNACGTSTAQTLKLYAVAPNPTTAINGPATVTANQSNVIYQLPNVAGFTYNWSVPVGATITSGQGTFKIKVKFGTASGAVKVFVSNPCGNSPTGSLAVTVAPAVVKSSDNTDQASALSLSIKAYPNPTFALANIEFSSNNQGEKYELIVRDISGKPLFTKTGNAVAGKNQVQIDLGLYANGVYLVSLVNNQGVATVKLYKEK